MGFKCITFPISKLWIQSSNFLTPSKFLSIYLYFSFFLSQSISFKDANSSIGYYYVYYSFLTTPMHVFISYSVITLLLILFIYFINKFIFLIIDLSILYESIINESLSLVYSSTQYVIYLECFLSYNTSSSFFFYWISFEEEVAQGILSFFDLFFMLPLVFKISLISSTSFYSCFCFFLLTNLISKLLSFFKLKV